MTKAEVREQLKQANAAYSAMPTLANKMESSVWTFIHCEMIYADIDELSAQRLAALKESGRMQAEATQRQIDALYK